MKITYRVIRNEWFDDKPDLTEGVQDFDDAETAIIESTRLNSLVPEQDSVQYHVRAIDYWKQ